ncbi:MAG TPA: hypothetical protein VM056_04625 [Terriglobales bacterium]|nr:hypothetical protein [Terriglobales bacterium]
MTDGRFKQAEQFGEIKTFGEVKTKVYAGDSAEDAATGAVEAITSKIPSIAYLELAVGCMAASLILKMLKKDDWALFVGLWPASFLIMGNYNKMVKQHGSDAKAA